MDVFAPLEDSMPHQVASQLFLDSTTASVREEMKTRTYGNIYAESLENETVKSLLSGLIKHPKSNPLLRKNMSKWLQCAIETIHSWLKKKPDPIQKRFAELQTLFKLSEKELDCLVFSFLIANHFWPCDDFTGSFDGEKLRKVSALLDLTETDYKDIVKEKSKLKRYGCLDRDADLDREMIPFIIGMSESSVVSRFFKPCKEKVLDWSCFGVLSENHGEFLKQLIHGRDKNHGINILLYGEPGTGKSSFARALAKELNYMPYVIAQTEDAQQAPSRQFRLGALQVCDEQVERENSLIIIDEADDLLENRRGEETFSLMFGSEAARNKGLLNDVLDTIKTPCLWITNSSARMLDSSNRRRFDYSIKFERHTLDQRKAIWKNVVAQNRVTKLINDEMIGRLAAKYTVSAGGITLAVRNVISLVKGKKIAAGKVQSLLEKVLKPHCQLMSINQGNEDKMMVASDYSLEGLNIKGGVKLDEIVEALQLFQEEQTKEETAGPDRPRMNILLSGMPGTGKTEFVKYLGQTLDTQIITRMGSDLLDKYVGGTEQNIRQAFEDAAGKKAILFLDEIDGVVQSRERSSHSWEVTQVNELLHQMENFNGVLIGATNFTDHLDPATIRRFTFKLDFDYLENTGKLLFFQKMLGSCGNVTLSREEEARLYRIPMLAPGDFRTVRQGMYYLKKSVTAPQLLDRLEQEVAAKRQGKTTGIIGFR